MENKEKLNKKIKNKNGFKWKLLSPMQYIINNFQYGCPAIHQTTHHQKIE